MVWVDLATTVVVPPLLHQTTATPRPLPASLLCSPPPPPVAVISSSGPLVVTAPKEGTVDLTFDAFSSECPDGPCHYEFHLWCEPWVAEKSFTAMSLTLSIGDDPDADIHTSDLWQACRLLLLVEDWSGRYGWNVSYFTTRCVRCVRPSCLLRGVQH